MTQNEAKLLWRRRRRRPGPASVLGGILLLSACQAGAQGPEGSSISAEARARISTITEESVLAHLSFLASDDLRGRDTPSPGLEQAAEYLAEQHRTFGLQAGAADGSFFQRWLYRDTMVPNVVALLPGSDPLLAHETIVLSAHFDHVGVGPAVAGDSIYNGADDNASGTTLLLEVARTLASLPAEERPRRSILFLHVSGEEKGLLGSYWWSENPTVPIDQVIANLNADMVGGNAHADTLVVLGMEYSSLGPLIRGVNAELPELGLTTAPDLWPQERLFFRSDQYNFMRKEIPALFLFTGLHECYHRPCDDLDFVDAAKVARISQLTAHTLLELANREARPVWDPAGLAEVRRMITGGG